MRVFEHVCLPLEGQRLSAVRQRDMYTLMKQTTIGDTRKHTRVTGFWSSKKLVHGVLPREGVRYLVSPLVLDRKVLSDFGHTFCARKNYSVTPCALVRFDLEGVLVLLWACFLVSLTVLPCAPALQTDSLFF